MRQVVNNIAPTIIFTRIFFFLNVNDDLKVSSQFHQSSANTI